MAKFIQEGSHLSTWFWTHFFQEDYYQFYIIVVLGFVYLEYRFRRLERKVPKP